MRRGELPMSFRPKSGFKNWFSGNCYFRLTMCRVNVTKSNLQHEVEKEKVKVKPLENCK